MAPMLINAFRFLLGLPPLDAGQAFMVTDDVTETYMVAEAAPQSIEDFSFTQTNTTLTPGDVLRPWFTSGDKFFSFLSNGAAQHLPALPE